MSFLRSWRDSRRFNRLSADDRAIVFYAESGQDWHHLAPIALELARGRSRTVCWVTSDVDDPAFEHADDRLRPFYVKDGFPLIVFFQMLRADVLVLTMMDLDNFHLKRSKHPVHYVYVFHSLGSTHMVDHADSYDHYDTILCAGPHQMREIRRREELAGLPPKRLVAHGYARLDALLRQARGEPRPPGEAPVVLVAPTWGETSLLHVCGEALVAALLDAGLGVILRPHYQTVKLAPDVVRAIREKHDGHPRLEYVDRMGESDSLHRSDVLVSDWSGMSIEYALGLEKPVLFVDVPRRVRNPEWESLDLEPLEAAIRTRVGAVLAPDRVADAPDLVRSLLATPGEFRARIADLRGEFVYHVGHSAEVGAAEIEAIADGAAASRSSG